MGKATANLENDHVHILQLIAVMEHIVKQRSSQVNSIENIVELIRNYADGLHHAKEEKLLFPKMVEKGYSFEQGPVAVMLHEHELGRKFVKWIAENLLVYKSGNMNAMVEIYKNMQAYIDLLKAHIDKENNVLFRMADHVFSAQDQQLLNDQFEQVDKNPVCGGVVADCIAQINRLSMAYNIS